MIDKKIAPNGTVHRNHPTKPNRTAHGRPTDRAWWPTTRGVTCKTCIKMMEGAGDEE